MVDAALEVDYFPFKLGVFDNLQVILQRGGWSIWISLGETHYAPNGINRLGAWAGAIAQSTDNIPMAEGDMLTGEVLGKRVAEMVLRFN